MADDLDEEWWKDSADDDGAEGLPPEEDGRDEKKQEKGKRGVKRQVSSRDDSESVDEPARKVQAQSGTSVKQKSKKKQKKGRGKFVRKKITGEDEDTLKKGGTPEDVIALLKPSIVVSQSDDSALDSDEESDGDDHNMLLKTDFYPANQELSSEDYLSEVLPGWQLAMEKVKLSPGSPLLLILCSSAIRAVQLNREIKSFLGKDCKTAKLFAKHMKLEEQKKFLKKKVCHAAIGTPNRVQALLEDGSLKLNQVHAIVLDWNWRDVKLKRMMDIPDVSCDLAVLLKEYALDHIRHSPCRIAIL